jgi:signal transduction histidine kinase
MRISTRIALGLGLLLALVMANAAYQLSVVQDLQRVSGELAGVRLEASRQALTLIQGADDVREFSAKALLLGDADYRAEWARAEARVERALGLLEAMEVGDAEGAERTALADAWAAWTGIMEDFRPGPGPAPADADPDAAAGSAAALEALDTGDPELLRLRVAAESLLTANEARVTVESAAAVRAGDRARTIAWVAAGVSLAGALLLGWLLWVAISDPLQRLTRGTRELARGRFEHRIDDRSRSEFGALARDFNLMAERLGELEELKQDFVSHVSHELKGPLAAIQETILVLLEELAGPLNERQRHLLQLSEVSATRLSRMIGNLLEMSRLEAGANHFDPAPVALAEVVESVLEESGPLADDRELVLAFEDHSSRAPGGGRLPGDADRLREVVANLVGNALKFSPEGGHIAVRIEGVDQAPPELPARYRELPGREPAPYLRLNVDDEGPGVPEGHREGIFEKFYQVRLDGRKTGQGVGLGLAISRRIVEGHGGAIWAESSPLGGARLSVLLPVRPTRWPELSALGEEAGDTSAPEGSTMVHA